MGEVESEEVCVVTGGRGFVARHLVLQLLGEGRFMVGILDLASELTLSPEEEDGPLSQALASGRAYYTCADLRSKVQVVKAFQALGDRRVAVVFHMAAPDSCCSSFKLHFDVTVTGTQNVIDACWECGVKKLVYTSSAIVVFNDVLSTVNGDESLPILKKRDDCYSNTKAQAEGLVLSANGKQGLITCAIRPSGIFGPGDTLTIPSFAGIGRYFIIGDGENMFDWTYVENVAHAHVCAERALVVGEIEGDNVASGKAYFVTNLEPVKFWHFVCAIVEGLGYSKPKYHIPTWLVIPPAEMADSIVKQLAAFIGVNPPFSLSAARIRIATTTRTFNSDRAVKLLGYKPLVSLQEGISRTLEAYPHLGADYVKKPASTADRDVKSGASRICRQGLLDRNSRVADVLLWRNPKASVGIWVGFVCVIYLVCASGYTLLSLLADFLFVSLIIIFTYSYLPDTIFGISLPIPVPPSSYELSEQSAQRIALTLRSSWNRCMAELERIALQKYFTLFFKVLLLLRAVKYFTGRFQLQSILSLSLFSAFTIPYLYERNEEDFEKLWALACKTFGSYHKTHHDELQNIRLSSRPSGPHS